MAFASPAVQDIEATSEGLEALYQSCLASKNIGDLQAAYDTCGQLVATVGS